MISFRKENINYTSQGIPKIIHQIWTQGCNKIPDKILKYVEKWKKKENYIHICWSDTSIIELLKKYDPSLIPIYTSFNLPQQRSDFGRYLLLYLYGGIYIDVDIIPGNKSFDSIFVNNKSIITGSGGHSGVSQSFIISKPKHPLFKDIIEHIRSSHKRIWYEFFDVLYVERTTGGSAYKKFIGKYRSDVYQLPQNLTPQCNSFEECSLETYRDSITLQNFDKTWNIFLIFQHFIVFYKYLMLLSTFFLLYLYISDCSSYGIEKMCRLKQVIFMLFIITILYQAIYYTINNKLCNTSIVYFILLLISYFSLSKKCDVCSM